MDLCLGMFVNLVFARVPSFVLQKTLRQMLIKFDKIYRDIKLMSQAENVEINAFCLNFQGLNYIINVRKYDLKYEFIYIEAKGVFL